MAKRLSRIIVGGEIEDNQAASVEGAQFGSNHPAFLDLLISFDNSDWQFDPGFFLRLYGPRLELDPNAAPHELRQLYVTHVSAHGLSPNGRFNEQAYLSENPDIQEAVTAGQFACGFHHWLWGGRHEQRTGWDQPIPDTSLAPEAPARKRKVRLVSAQPLSAFPYGGRLSEISVEEARRVLLETGLVNKDKYLSWYPDLKDVDYIEHYITWGFKEGRLIHEFFDEKYYRKQSQELAQLRYPAILHYLFLGAKSGLNPHILLDTAKYVAEHGLDLDRTNPLIHYSLASNKRALVQPPLFDYQYYVGKHPEAEEFPGGALMHFLTAGVYTGFRPSASFNTLYYYATHLNGDFTQNAYIHYLKVGRSSNLLTDQPKEEPTIAKEIARFSNPGPAFEELDASIAKGQRKRARLIAFYLPQFHAFPENDEWWGKGFTEWRNLPKALPRFAGHYQPRIPRDLGYYNLDDPAVMRRQVQMAIDMGLWAFCFYFYWFNRHRLMEKPLEAFLDDKTLDMPFMILWANENWTRRWDGADQEILIKQDQLPEDDEALVDCLQSYFSDARYVRISGRPLFVIYRADIIKDSKVTLDRWRALFKARHDEEPLFFLAQTFLAEDPDQYGFDGAIEFPPHKMGNYLNDVYREMKILDWDFEGSVLRYSDAIRVSLDEPPPTYPLAKTVFPSWDNSSRRKTGSIIFGGANPRLFGEWLDGAINYAQRNPVLGENIVFINAWNEWCESAYLEPDIYNGGAVLNKIAEVISAPTPKYRDAKYKILLVGHDAFPAGAQRNLLALARVLQNRFGIEVQVILLGVGNLLQDYASSVPTLVSSQQQIDERLFELRTKGFSVAITNTVVSGKVMTNLKAHGFAVTALIHELPDIIAEYHLEKEATQIAKLADHVVFASTIVQDAFETNFGSCENTPLILPQGVYNVFDTDLTARENTRRALGIDPSARVVINVGHGDFRKGIDLFLQTAILSFNRGSDTQFIWVGSLHPNIGVQIRRDMARSGITNLHLVGETSDISAYMNAADAFLLTSREDPFPSVLLEAMQIGLPIVAYDDNGGYIDLLRSDRRLGQLINQGDLEASLSAIDELVEQTRLKKSLVDYRKTVVRRRFDFVEYAFTLVKTLNPELQKISVVVPNYNYENYIAARLDSIFKQSYPVYEIIVLDDASTDESLAEINATSERHRREIKVVEADQNSGNVFAQWQKGAHLASGELLWIAEADDLSEPPFLHEMARLHADNQNCIFSFSDSQSIDSCGYKVYESYIDYAESIVPGLLTEDRIFLGKQFAKEGLSIANLVLNVSSVVWNKDAMVAAFGEIADSDLDFKLAGDWRIYLVASTQSGKICYCSKALNIHRRHRRSVTRQIDIESHVKEIEDMHKLALKAVGNKPDLRKAQAAYLAQTRRWLAEGSE